MVWHCLIVFLGEQVSSTMITREFFKSIRLLFDQTIQLENDLPYGFIPRWRHTCPPRRVASLPVAQDGWLTWIVAGVWPFFL